MLTSHPAAPSVGPGWSATPPIGQSPTRGPAVRTPLPTSENHPDHSRQRGLHLGTVTVGTAIHSFVHSSACIKCLLCSNTAPAPGGGVTKLPRCRRHRAVDIARKRGQEQTRNTLIPSHQGAESEKETESGRGTEGARATLEKSGLSEREGAPGGGRPAQRPRAWWGERAW